MPDYKNPVGNGGNILKTQAGGLAVQVIRNLSEWNALELEWRTLFVQSPTASPPLRWEWMQDWWSLYSPTCAASRQGDDGLRIYVVRRSGQIIGLLPLYINRKGAPPFQTRRLIFLSTGEDESEEICAEYPDLLHLPGEGEACAEILRTTLFAEPRPDWDGMELEPLSETSPLMAWRNGPESASVTFEERGCAYLANLEEGFEGYLNGLSHNSRGLARKRMRGTARAGAVLEVASDRETAAAIFEELRSLHQARWERDGMPGCFASSRFETFHRRQVERGVESGETVLARLRHGEETVAAMLGYVAGTKFDSYVSGARLEDLPEIKSPGIVLHLLLTEYLSQRGITRYDHLAGDARYKQQYTNATVPRYCLSWDRRTLRGAMQRAMETAHRAVRKGRRILAGSVAHPQQPVIHAAEQSHE